MIADSSERDEAGALLEQVVSLYNAGVSSRDFAGLLAILTDDVVLDFEGMPERGPISGLAQVRQHFADDPPDDGIRVKRWKHSGNEIVAEFGWVDIPEGSGCLFIETRDNRVARLTMALGGPRCLFH